MLPSAELEVELPAIIIEAIIIVCVILFKYVKVAVTVVGTVGTDELEEFDVVNVYAGLVDV